jgi:hypothetical protein
MASLQNEQIDQSYQGLIKTANNLGGAPFPPVKLQYGDGTELPISIGDGTSIGIGDIVTLQSGTRVIDLNANNLALTGVTFVDALAGTTNISNGTYEFGLGFPGAPATNVDFTNATVTGLPSGSAGLENGTGADSLQSASSLTTNAANASGAQSIALGDGATAPGSNAIAIGKGADTGASSDEVIVIGNSTGGTAASESIRIGHDIPGSSFNSNNVAIGNNFDSINGNGNVMIGNSASSASDYNTLVGYNTTALFQNGVAIGRDATAGNQAAVIAIGHGATGGAFAGAIALGRNTQANADAAVALGDGVIAATADTVSVKALEVQTDSTANAGGIIMSDAGGTDRRINIDATGKLYIDNTAVSGGGGGSTSHPARYFGTGNLATTFEGPYTFFSDDILFYAVHLQEGEEVTELAVEVGTAFTNTTSIGMALYDTQLGSSTVQYIPNNKLLDLGTADPTTTGVKTFTGSTYTATYTGMYMFALGFNGQWDGTFRQTESNQRTYSNDNFFTSNTTLGFARDFNVAEPIRYNGYSGTMPTTFAESQSFNNTSAKLALMGKTAQNI